MRLLVLIALLFLASAPTSAQDWVAANGRLSDQDFYRLVSCGAKPGGACKDDVARWPPQKARDLTVSIYRVVGNYPGPLRNSARVALDGAIAEINRAGAALHLRRLPDGEFADIRVFLLDIKYGGTISGTGLELLDGDDLEAARVRVWWDARKQIVDAAIAFSKGIKPREMRSVMLEELTQSLGFLTDIRDRWYNRRSVFAEDSNSVTTLGEQDRMVLRRHYPPGM